MYPALIPVALILAALAGVSLLLPWEPVYDPWGWLVWGREVAGLELDTRGGPSWKPLPVIFTTAFSAAPDAAPDLWLAVARAGWLAAAAAAALLAARVQDRAVEPRGSRGARRRERVAAAAMAALGLVLLHDAFTPWLRQFAGGLSEPLLVALVLLAAERGLAARHGPALALATTAALIRPEVWPFLAAYGAWLWRSDQGGQTPVGVSRGRLGVLVSLFVVPVLWFVPDLIASGSIFTGAERAREGSGSPPIEALEVLGRAANLPLTALWVGFVPTLLAARRREDRAVLAVGLGALAWIALVAAMAAGGYAGLPRFLAPAAGVVCALGAAGLVGLATAAVAVRPRGRRWPSAAQALAAALAIALVVQAGFRIADLENAASAADRLGAAQAGLARLAAANGAELRGCGPAAVDAIEGQTALAWWLDLPIDAVDVSARRPAGGSHVIRQGAGWRLISAGKLGCPNSE